MPAISFARYHLPSAEILANGLNYPTLHPMMYTCRWHHRSLKARRSWVLVTWLATKCLFVWFVWAPTEWVGSVLHMNIQLTGISRPAAGETGQLGQTLEAQQLHGVLEMCGCMHSATRLLLSWGRTYHDEVPSRKVLQSVELPDVRHNARNRGSWKMNRAANCDSSHKIKELLFPNKADWVPENCMA